MARCPISRTGVGQLMVHIDGKRSDTGASRSTGTTDKKEGIKTGSKRETFRRIIAD